MPKKITRSSVVLAATVAGVALSTAAAAVLPGAASDTAREHTTDVTVPGPNAAAGDHPSGVVADAVEHAVAKDSIQTTSEDTHGAEVSDLATSTTLTGAEKGAAIAAVASDGRSAARGESAEHATDGQAKAADASAKGQAKAATHKP